MLNVEAFKSIPFYNVFQTYFSTPDLCVLYRSCLSLQLVLSVWKVIVDRWNTETSVLRNWINDSHFEFSSTFFLISGRWL